MLNVQFCVETEDARYDIRSVSSVDPNIPSDVVVTVDAFDGAPVKLVIVGDAVLDFARALLLLQPNAMTLPELFPTGIDAAAAYPSRGTPLSEGEISDLLRRS